MILPAVLLSYINTMNPPEGYVGPRVCTPLVSTGKGTEEKKVQPEPTYHHKDAHGNSSRLLNPFAGPRNLRESLAWTWHHPQGRYYTFTNGVVIDDQKNLYLSAMDAIRKFSPDGELVWTYCAPSDFPMPSMISLGHGAVFGVSQDAIAYSLSMETGQVLWQRQVGAAVGEDKVGGDQSNVQEHDGIVIVGTEKCVGNKACDDNGNSGSMVLHGLNATDGSSLWDFKPDVAVWNFYTVFLDDGTFVYQDLEGRVYRNRLADGTLIWKSGGWPGSWTDGCLGLGPNGMVYAVTNHGPNVCGFKMCEADVSAYRILDGQLIWKTDTPASTNAFPAVGPAFGPRGGLQVVVNNDHAQLSGYDAETGQFLWMYQADGNGELFKGDRAGLPIRLMVMPRRPKYVPNFWSNVAVGADGTVYGGLSEGRFYALFDLNGDGQIDPMTEASMFDAGAAFPGTGPALAPGMVAVASSDTMFVFKSKSGSHEM